MPCDRHLLIVFMKRRIAGTLGVKTNRGVRFMRHTMWMTAFLIAGCAGEPGKLPPIREAAFPTASPQPVASVQPGDQSGSVAGKRVLEAKKQGFKLVNKNGDVLYCRTELKTGSHVVKETTCLTEEELDEVHQQTNQDLRNQLKPQLPPPGK
jgi:hypothetical protein